MTLRKTIEITAAAAFHSDAVNTAGRQLEREGWDIVVQGNLATMGYTLHAKKDVPDFAPHPTSEAY